MAFWGRLPSLTSFSRVYWGHRVLTHGQVRKLYPSLAGSPGGVTPLQDKLPEAAEDGMVQKCRSAFSSFLAKDLLFFVLPF